ASELHNITRGTFSQQRKIETGFSLRLSKWRHEPRHVGSNANLSALAADVNDGYNNMQSCSAQRLFATPRRAEGYGRFHYLDNAKFCSNARGSCWEVLDHLITSRDEELLPEDLLVRGRDLVATAVKLLNGYMRYLKRGNPNNE